MKACAMVFLLALAGAAFADRGFVPRAIPVLDRPAIGAKSLASLQDKQAVEILRRGGAWLQIKAGAISGWVPLAAVRLASGAQTAMAVGARPMRKNDTGIRGFSEEELLAGAPNRTEAARLNALAVPAAEAERFARAGKLQPRPQDYLEMQDYMPAEGLPPDFFDE